MFSQFVSRIAWTTLAFGWVWLKSGPSDRSPTQISEVNLWCIPWMWSRRKESFFPTKLSLVTAPTLTLYTNLSNNVAQNSLPDAAVSEVIDELPSDFKYFKVDPEPVSEKFPNLKKRATLVSELIKKQSTEKPMDRPATLNDPIMYVFTSGTTGLPKAATIKHSRLVYEIPLNIIRCTWINTIGSSPIPGTF